MSTNEHEDDRCHLLATAPEKLKLIKFEVTQLHVDRAKAASLGKGYFCKSLSNEILFVSCLCPGALAFHDKLCELFPSFPPKFYDVNVYIGGMCSFKYHNVELKREFYAEYRSTDDQLQKVVKEFDRKKKVSVPRSCEIKLTGIFLMPKD